MIVPGSVYMGRDSDSAEAVPSMIPADFWPHPPASLRILMESARLKLRRGGDGQALYDCVTVKK